MGNSAVGDRLEFSEERAFFPATPVAPLGLQILGELSSQPSYRPYAHRGTLVFIRNWVGGIWPLGVRLRFLEERAFPGGRPWRCGGWRSLGNYPTGAPVGPLVQNVKGGTATYLYKCERLGPSRLARVGSARYI
jgi:hypothetical protein